MRRRSERGNMLRNLNARFSRILGSEHVGNPDRQCNQGDPLLCGCHRAVRAAAVRLRLDDSDRPQDRRAEHLLPSGVHLSADAGELPGGLPAVQLFPLSDEQPRHRHPGDGHLAGAGAAGGLFHCQVPAGKDRYPDPGRPDDAVRELPAALVHHLPLPEADRHLHRADDHPPDHHDADGDLADGLLFREHARRAGRRGDDRRLLPLAELPPNRAAARTQRHRHLGDHVLHLLVEPVPLLADPLGPEDQDRAGRRL